MIDNTTIKKLRMENDFSQTMLAKATAFDPTTISNYENGKRNITIDTMEKIANVFGRTLSLEHIDKTSSSKNIELYKDKTAEEIIELDEQDIINYIFVKESDERLMDLCNLDLKVYNRLNYEQIKDILGEHIRRCLRADKAILYNFLTKEYPLYDYNVMDFLCSIHEVIKESTGNMSTDIKHKIEKDLKFLKIKLDGTCSLTIDDIQFLDSECNDIDIKREDIEVGIVKYDFSNEAVNEVVQFHMKEFNYDYSSETDIYNYLKNWNNEANPFGLSHIKDEDKFEISSPIFLDYYRQLDNDMRVLSFFTFNPIVRFKY